MSSTKFVSKSLLRMETAVEWIVTAILAVMVVNISMAVFFRFVLNSGLFWAEEMSRYLMIWAGMLGAGLAMKDGSHVGINAFIDLFSPAVKRVMRLIAYLVVLCFLIVVFFKTFGHLKSLSIQTSAAMQIPMAIPYLSVTFGFLLMSIEDLVLIARLFAKAEPAGDGK
jgi:TRAP-type C4-dicarboxylate transport system permease small subunit